jgi:hypothetical protein
MIDSGEVSGIEAIAAQYRVDRAYVSRILGLTSLAPDITGAILAGNDPASISLKTLHGEMPVCWQEQREM